MKTRKLLLMAVMACLAMTGFGQTWNCGYPNEADVTATLDNGTLTISGTGNMTDYTYSSTPPWYSVYSQITQVVIKDGVTSIGAYAFSDYDFHYDISHSSSNIVSVTIGNSVTNIGADAFFACTRLLSVNIPDSVKTIGGGAFCWCTNLASVTIGSGVTSIGDAAFSITAFTSVTIPNSVTSIGGDAFSNSGLTSISIPNGSIGTYAFECCANLTSVTIGSGVTNIGDWILADCHSLASITIMNADPANISMEDDIETVICEDEIMNNCLLIVPDGALDLYKNAPVWGDFPYIVDKSSGLTVVNINLSNLAISTGTLSPEFSPTTYKYKVVVPKSVASIVLAATPKAGATVSGDGQKNLNIGENTFDIKVNTPLDGFAYTVTISRMAYDYVLLPTNYKEIETGEYEITFYNDPVTGGNMTFLPIDKYEFEYELTTGDFSGDLPLHFDIGNGQATYDTTVNVAANSFYKITLDFNLLPPRQGDISYTTKFNSYGVPYLATLNYDRQLCDVIASDDKEELSTTQINRVYYKSYGGNDIASVSVYSSLIGNATSLEKEISAVSTITVYPSPAVDFITISGLQGNETLNFYNINGQLLITRKASGETENVPVGNLPSGIYFVKISNGQILKWVKR